MNLRNVMMLAMIALLTAACASSNSSGVYRRDETRQVSHIKMATVESVRPVKIEGTQSNVGAAAGGVIGGVAGSMAGQSKVGVLGAVVGAVAGGLAGNAIEEGLTRKDGVEVTIKLDGSSDLIAIVQETDEEFHPGDRVRVIESGGVTRVSH